jgi:hypothetical protein
VIVVARRAVMVMGRVVKRIVIVFFVQLMG